MLNNKSILNHYAFAYVTVPWIKKMEIIIQHVHSGLTVFCFVFFYFVVVIYFI